jgi:transposase
MKMRLSRRLPKTPIFRRVTGVERCINWLKQWHGLATRYEKRVVNYRAMVIIASIAIWFQS